MSSLFASTSALKPRNLLQPLRALQANFSNSTKTNSTLSPTHYLVTLKRSPLHLPKDSQASCLSIGLKKRLSTNLIPINLTNSGNLLNIKELVEVKLVNLEDYVTEKLKGERSGEGRIGAGLNGRGGNGVIRVGTDRCRGEERGFKVL